MITLRRIPDRTYKRKWITQKMIAAHFGSINIEGCCGFFTVRDWRVKVSISPRKIKLIEGGAAAYSAVVRLAGEAFGRCKVRGDQTSMVICMSHAEMWAVNIQPDFSNPLAFAWRALVFLLICIGGFKLVEGTRHDHQGTILLIIFGAELVFCFMKWRSRRAAQKRLEASGFAFPT